MREEGQGPREMVLIRETCLAIGRLLVFDLIRRRRRAPCRSCASRPPVRRALARPSAPNPFLCRHAIQRHIPRTGVDCLYSLTLVGEAYQAGALPAAAYPQVGEGAVVESAAHPEAVAVGVESDQGNQEEVQGPGKADASSAEVGLGNAEPVPRQAAVLPALDEPELLIWVCSQHREKDALVPGTSRGQERCRVDLAVVAAIGADAAGADEQGVPAETTGQGFGMLAALPGGNRIATHPQDPSQLRSGNHAVARRDIPRLCRCRPLFLNHSVQVGAIGVASGFPLVGGHAQQLHLLAPWVRIRLKKIPRPSSSTAGDVLSREAIPIRLRRPAPDVPPVPR